MKAFKIFQLEKKEAWIVFVLGFALLANAMAMQVSGIVAVSGFLSGDNVNQILIVLFVDYALIITIGSLTSVIIDKFNRVALMQWVAIAFALAFILLRIMFMVNAPNWLNYSVMYILAEQQFVVFPVVFWVLANDIFKLSQAKRIFPLISGWNFIGKLLGIGIAAVSPSIFANLGIKPEEILLLNVMVYLIAFMILFAGLRNVSTRKTVQREESLKETLSEGWDFVRNVPSFNYVMLALIALAVADTIIEFRFLVITDTVFTTQQAYQTFFSIYRLGTTLVALLLQAFVTGYLIKQMQLKNTFYFFPLAATIGVIGMILLPGVGIAIGAMALVKLVRDTIHESGRNSFLGLVPEERRGRVSILMETYFPSFGTMFGCILAGAVVYAGIYLGRDLSLYYLGIGLVGALYAIYAIIRMSSKYDASLYNWRLKRRQRRADTQLLDRISE
jgi:MFS family permease